MTERPTDGQWYALGTLLGEREEGAMKWLVNHLITGELVTDLTARHWRVLRDRAYPYWRDDDWETVDITFQNELQAAKHAYLEHLGQENLFT